MLFTMSPNEKDIINISKPSEWCPFLSFLEFSLYLVHIYTGISGSTLCTNGKKESKLFVEYSKGKKQAESASISSFMSQL